MNGMELCRSYYHEVIEPRIRSECPHALERIAVGLLGHGSQCLGYDDEISRDHDWGPRVCILLGDEDYKRLGSDLEKVVGSLPSEYMGFEASWEHLGPRGGALNIRDWFRSLLDGRDIPREPVDWLPIREYELLSTTNGEIWHDGTGEVTELRRHLSYYPDAAWRKRLAGKCVQISQSTGNVGRCAKRDDVVATSFSLHRFVRDAMQIWFLLNRRYAPFYKWLYRAFKGLPGTPDGMAADLETLAGPVPLGEKQATLARIEDETREAVNDRFPDTSRSGPFYEVAIQIDDSIEDAEVRGAGVWDQIEY